MNTERTLAVFLRMVGSFSLTAIFFVFVPYERMNNIHQLLGMGELPAEPVVGYLARSLSAFYAIVGGLMWVVSFDVKQHLAVIRYLGAALTIFGILILGIDIIEGMPMFWRLGEGPIVLVFGILIFMLAGKVEQ